MVSSLITVVFVPMMSFFLPFISFSISLYPLDPLPFSFIPILSVPLLSSPPCYPQLKSHPSSSWGLHQPVVTQRAITVLYFICSRVINSALIGLTKLVFLYVFRHILILFTSIFVSDLMPSDIISTHLCPYLPLIIQKPIDLLHS